MKNEMVLNVDASSWSEPENVRTTELWQSK